MATSISKEIHSNPVTPEHVTAKRPRIEEPVKRPATTAEPIEISRGAEALVSRIPYLDRLAVRKERFAKRYRHPELDAKLTSRRLAQEARMLLRLRKAGIRVPALYRVDMKSNILIMEYVPGKALKDFLQSGNHSNGFGNAIMTEAGKAVARMHKCDVVHGDLTTGNIMVLEKVNRNDADLEQDKVCIIDFGLSSANATEEDMAVDLYVLERAVISAHSESAQPLNDAFLDAYAKELNRPAVMKRLAEVRCRGRKRDMVG